MLTPLVGSAVFSTTRALACRGVGVERAAGPGHGGRLLAVCACTGVGGLGGTLLGPEESGGPL